MYESQEDVKLNHILQKQRQHQEQLNQSLGSQRASRQSDYNQSVRSESDLQDTTVGSGLEDSLTQNKDSNHGNRTPVRAWGRANESPESTYRRTGQCNTCENLQVQEVNSEDYDAQSQTSLLDSESTYLPLNVNATPSRPMTAPAVSSPSTHTNFPSFFTQQNIHQPSFTEGRYEAYDKRPIKPANPEMFKGEKKPNFQYSPPTQSGNEPAVFAKKKTPPTAQAHDYDTSQEVSQIENILNPPKEKIPKENIPTEDLAKIKDVADRKARRSASQKTSAERRQKNSSRLEKTDSSKSSIPVSRNTTNLSRTHSDYLPGKYAGTSRKSGDIRDRTRSRHSDKSDSKNVKTSSVSILDSGVYSRPSSDAVLADTTNLTNTGSYYRQHGQDHKAATMIQASWRGYHAREKDPDVVSVRKELRARRAEDHIVVLKSELERQRKLYEEERHLRALQMEAIRYLAKEVQSLQSWKSEVLASQQFRTMDSNRQDDSYNYSEEIQQTLERMETMHNKTGASSRDTGYTTVDAERHKDLEKTCASLQNQVSQLSQALQSVSSVVFQSGFMGNAMDTTDMDGSLLVTGYEDESSCDEANYNSTKWGCVPHSLSPYPSEEEEQYFLTVPQPGFPTPPRNLRLEHKGENSVVISWQASKILDGHNREMNKPLVGYRVFINEKPLAMIGQGGLKALIHGLNPKDTYKIYVRAVSALGESNTSDVLMTAYSVGNSTSQKRISSSDSNVTDEDSDKDLDSTESSDIIQKRIEARQKRRIKSPRQDKRTLASHGKESSASDQDNVKDRERPSSRSESRPSSSRSNANADGIFVQPKLHTHRRTRSKESNVPHVETTGAGNSSEQTVQLSPRPMESQRSPSAGSQSKDSAALISSSKMSETFTIETSGSLLQAITNAQGALGMNISDSSESSVRTHRRKRSKDLNVDKLADDVSQTDNSNSSAVPTQPGPDTSERDDVSTSSQVSESNSQVKTHRRNRSKDYEWRKDIEYAGSNLKDRDFKKAWVKDAPSGEVHGIPIIDARKRHHSGSRPSSPAPSDVSEKSQPERKKTVADMLEKFSSKSFGGSLGANDTEGGLTSALPPRQKRAGSHEDVREESRRTPTKNMSPTYGERRRTPSNGSESDASEISSSSAARQLDMDRKSTGGTAGIVSKLLQKLQTFSKSQEENLQQRTHKIKKKSIDSSGGEEGEVGIRRPRKKSESESEATSVTEKHRANSDSSSQSDDPQLGKKPYKTHRRSGSDHRSHRQTHHSSAPTTPSRPSSYGNQPSEGTFSYKPQNLPSPTYVPDYTPHHPDYTPRPQPTSTQPRHPGTQSNTQGQYNPDYPPRPQSYPELAHQVQQAPANPDYTPRPESSNVKRTASFHGRSQRQPEVTAPRRSGSEENLYNRSMMQQQNPPQQPFMAGILNRKNRPASTGSGTIHHIPILSGAQLQKQPKNPPP